MDPAEQPDDQLARVGERLRLAFVALGEADLADADRERLHRRLIGVTNSAKRDLGRAEAALDRFDAELAAARAPRSS